MGRDYRKPQPNRAGGYNLITMRLLQLEELHPGILDDIDDPYRVPNSTFCKLFVKSGMPFHNIPMPESAPTRHSYSEKVRAERGTLVVTEAHINALFSHLEAGPPVMSSAVALAKLKEFSEAQALAVQPAAWGTW